MQGVGFALGLAAVMRGQLHADDFKYGESPDVPPNVSIPNRAMMNLLEMPMLFYLVGVIFYVPAR